MRASRVIDKHPFKPERESSVHEEPVETIRGCPTSREIRPSEAKKFVWGPRMNLDLVVEPWYTHPDRPPAYR